MSEILKYGVSSEMKTRYRLREKKFLNKPEESLNFKRNLRIMFRTKMTGELFGYKEMAAYNPHKTNYGKLLSIMGYDSAPYINRQHYIKQQTDAVPKKIAIMKTS